MKRTFKFGKIFLVATSVITGIHSYAQNELVIFPSATTDNKSVRLEDRLLQNSLPATFQNELSGFGDSTDFSTDYRLYQPINHIPEFQLPKFTYQYHFPENYYGYYPINTQSFITTSRVNTHYYGLGGVSSADANYYYRLNDVVSFTGGLSLSKYNIYNQFNNDVSINGGINFELGDRATLHLFGNYSVSSALNNDPRMDFLRSAYSPFYPSSGYGGAFEFKVTDTWGIMTGANREFDPFTRKWITRPFIMPVFYSK
jgi:hypothetical protein